MTDEELARTDRHPQPWQPESRPRVLALIGKLGEEADELGAICARIVIQGLEAPHSDDGRPNVLHLEDEIADVAALTGLAMSGVGWRPFGLMPDGLTPVFTAPVNLGLTSLDFDRVENRRAAKKRFLLAWLASLSCEPPPEDLAQLLKNAELAAYERAEADLAALRADRDSWKAIAERFELDRNEDDSVSFIDGEAE